MIYKNPTIEILIRDHPVVSGVEYNVISKFEIDRPRFDGSIDIKLFRYPLILPSLLPSLFSFLYSPPSFLFFPIHFLVGSSPSTFLAHFFQEFSPTPFYSLLFSFFFFSSFCFTPQNPSPLPMFYGKMEKWMTFVGVWGLYVPHFLTFFF